MLTLKVLLFSTGNPKTLLSVLYINLDGITIFLKHSYQYFRLILTALLFPRGNPKTLLSVLYNNIGGIIIFQKEPKNTPICTLQ